MLAQLRDVLAAENSAVVAQKNDDSRLRFPQRAEAHGTLVGIGKNDGGQLRAETFCGHFFGTLSPIEFNSPWARVQSGPEWAQST